MRTGALAVAIVMIAVAAGAVIWKRRLVTITVVCLVFFIPVLGLGAYVLHRTPVAPAGLFLLAAVISTLFGGGAVIAALRSPQVPLRRPVYFYLLALGAAIAGSASLAAIWAPEFAVADIVVNLGWALAWLSPSQRTTDVEASVDIGAARSRVFQFLVDPSNWPKYQEWTDPVQVEPPPPLAEGSRVTVVSSGPDFRGRPSPETTTVTYLVDEMVPNSSIDMVMLGQLDNRITWRLSDSPTGTTFSSRAWGVVPYPLAVFGLMLEFWQHWNLRLARVRETQARLKQLLDEPARSA